MKSKVLKYSAYVFVFCLLSQLILSQVTNPPKIVDVLKIVCLGVSFLVILLYVVIFIYCYIDNKKIASLLDHDEYDQIIQYSNKKTKKIFFLLSERKVYYQYLAILAYVGKDDYETFEQLFEKFQYKSEYPMTYYWKMCFEFSRFNFAEVSHYKNDFYFAFQNKRNKARYQDIFYVIEALDFYCDQQILKAKESISHVNEKQISMPSTHRCIEFIKNANLLIDEEPQTE